MSFKCRKPRKDRIDYRLGFNTSWLEAGITAYRQVQPIAGGSWRDNEKQHDQHGDSRPWSVGGGVDNATAREAACFPKLCLREEGNNG